MTLIELIAELIALVGLMISFFIFLFLTIETKRKENSILRSFKFQVFIVITIMIIGELGSVITKGMKSGYDGTGIIIDVITMMILVIFIALRTSPFLVG